MNQSEHFNLNLVEGTDKVNPLTQDVPNYEAIDAQMYANQQASIGEATELVSGTVHALTRTVATPVFRFTATANFTAGETFVVDGVQVTALTPAGGTLATGSYITGAEVICALRDTVLTVFVSGVETADNALHLEGHSASYFGTTTAVNAASEAASAAGTLAQTATNDITNIKSNLTASGTKFLFDYQNGKFGYNTSETRGADTFFPFSSGGAYGQLTSLSVNTTYTIDTGISDLKAFCVFGESTSRRICFICTPDLIVNSQYRMAGINPSSNSNNGRNLLNVAFGSSPLDSTYPLVQSVSNGVITFKNGTSAGLAMTSLYWFAI